MKKLELLTFEETAKIGGVVTRIPPIWAKQGKITTRTMVVRDKKTNAFLASRKLKEFPAFVPRKKKEKEIVGKRKLVEKEVVQNVLGLTQAQVNKVFFDYFDHIVRVPFLGELIPIEVVRKIEKNIAKYKKYDAKKCKSK